MTKRELDEIIEIRKELEYIEAKIESLEKRIDKVREKKPSCDIVKGSDDEAPFVLHHILIQGIEKSDYRVMLNLEKELLEQKKAQEEMVKRYSETLRKIDQYIKTVKESKNRQIFSRYYYDGMTYEEIAEDLNISDKTVSRRMYQMLENFKSVR